MPSNFVTLSFDCHSSCITLYCSRSNFVSGFVNFQRSIAESRETFGGSGYWASYCNSYDWINSLKAFNISSRYDYQGQNTALSNIHYQWPLSSKHVWTNFIQLFLFFDFSCSNNFHTQIISSYEKNNPCRQIYFMLYFFLILISKNV